MMKTKCFLLLAVLLLMVGCATRPADYDVLRQAETAASQASTWGVPQAGPVTPSVMAQRMQASLDALLTAHRGTSRPTYAAAGTIWIKTIDATESQVYFFDGTADIYMGRLDITNGLYFPVAGGIGTGVIRKVTLRITDGTIASTIRAQVIDRYNGDTVSEVDNIPATDVAVGGFELDSGADTAPDIEILASVLTGNCLAVLDAQIELNTTGTNLAVTGYGTANNIKLFFSQVPSGSAVDIENLVDNGYFSVAITYLTDE